MNEAALVIGYSNYTALIAGTELITNDHIPELRYRPSDSRQMFVNGSTRASTSAFMATRVNLVPSIFTRTWVRIVTMFGRCERNNCA